MNVMLIIRGAPGAGKTTIAQALVKAGLFDVYVEADQFYSLTGEYKYDPKKIGMAHQWVREQVEGALIVGESVIISDTSVHLKDLLPYQRLALIYNYRVQEMVLPDPVFQNVHGVPQEKVDLKKQGLLDSLKYQYRNDTMKTKVT